MGVVWFALAALGTNVKDVKDLTWISCFGASVPDVRAGDARGVAEERVVGHDAEGLAALELDLAALVGEEA